MKSFFKKVKRIFSGQCTYCGTQKIKFGDIFPTVLCPYCDLCPPGSSKSYRELDEEAADRPKESQPEPDIQES
jgi:hypothetical protein